MCGLCHQVICYSRLSLTGSTPCRARFVVLVRTSSLSSHVIVGFPALSLLLSPWGMSTPQVVFARERCDRFCGRVMLLAVLHKRCSTFVRTCCYRFAVVGDQKLSLLLHRTTHPSLCTGVSAGGLNPVSAVNQVLNLFQVVCLHHREELIVSAVIRFLTYPIAVRRWVLCVANCCL